MKKKINFKDVTPETWARTIFLIVSLVNQFLQIFGKEIIPWSESQIYTTVTYICTAISAIWAWWKNNSFSKGAQDGDKVMKASEAGELEYSAKVFQPDTNHYTGRG